MVISFTISPTVNICVCGRVECVYQQNMFRKLNTTSSILSKHQVYSAETIDFNKTKVIASFRKIVLLVNKQQI